MNNISDENDTKSKMLEILSRINPYHAGTIKKHKKLKESDSSDDEDAIEFKRLESDKVHLLNQLRVR